jgi:hypothetical protein
MKSYFIDANGNRKPLSRAQAAKVRKLKPIA